ncbi:hypothetical protein GpartN1_g1441.t1 [Galdieria partita]|uniref:Uncharacterized protein n=1 Tax=Galdieria partita TaxID=83374 RepID=A0A9C7PSD3_9RHOD|nr:hypothetical protein GpartN1_g1441.t1 [Galdieria partita]
METLKPNAKSQFWLKSRWFQVYIIVLCTLCILCFSLQPETLAKLSLEAYRGNSALTPRESMQDTLCDVHTLYQENQVKLNKKLSKLVQRTFFRIFKVDLSKECPFWPDDGQCALRDCSVCACSEDEIPVLWRLGDNQGTSSFLFKSSSTCESSGGRDVLNDVDRNLGDAQFNKWREDDEDVWIIEDSDDSMIYVDLIANPERYTGYQGASASRVWKAIYNENCFLFSDNCTDQEVCALQQHHCKEQRVFYRLISGIHTSINMHIAKEYLFKTRWGPNVKLYEERVRPFPDRVENLYFAFAVILRAISKAVPLLSPQVYDYRTGNVTEDEITAQVLTDVFSCSKLLTPNCLTFDERELFRTPEGNFVRKQFKDHFRNISAIMDCVGCEKCRLWGKLQFLGVGTALKILFDDPLLSLQHNEVSSLLNVLHKLSTSVVTVAYMERLRLFQRIREWLFVASCILVIGLFFMFFFRRSHWEQEELNHKMKSV